VCKPIIPAILPNERLNPSGYPCQRRTINTGATRVHVQCLKASYFHRQSKPIVAETSIPLATMAELALESVNWSDFMERKFDSEESDDEFIPTVKHADGSLMDTEMDLDDDASDDSYISSTEDDEVEQDKSQPDISPLTIRDDKPPLKYSMEKDFEDRENEFLNIAPDANSGTSLEAQIAQLIQETDSMQQKLELDMKNNASDLVLQFEHLILKRDYLNAASKLQNRTMI
jgi:hypothetical protein